MNKQELQTKIDTINRLILEVRAFKDANPECKTGFQPASCGSLLNAYREGDIGFEECVKLLDKAPEVIKRALARYDNPAEKHNTKAGGFARAGIAEAMASDLRETEKD